MTAAAARQQVDCAMKARGGGQRHDAAS
jgi:hypothetical protein